MYEIDPTNSMSKVIQARGRRLSGCQIQYALLLILYLVSYCSIRSSSLSWVTKYTDWIV